MKLVQAIGAVGLLSCGASASDVVAGEAKRGEQLFRTQQCIHCHSLNGHGGTYAPDLTRRIDRNYNPAVMASVMWNHAPQMWAGMKRENLAQPRLSAQQAADLFAFFVLARYFELRGDAGRGKQLFASNACADCHGITESKSGGAPPIVKWESLADPVVLVQQMWNHGSNTTAALGRRKIGRLMLTPQDLTDILVYLQNLPQTPQMASSFSLQPSDSGAELFQSKGCAGCHSENLTHEFRHRSQTLTGIAAAMWDHHVSMKQPVPQLSKEEMRQIIGYIWARQYFRGDGNSTRGKKVFETKHCSACHNDSASGAPKLPNGRNAYSAVTMVSVLWEHGPEMLDRMREKKIPWPRFKGQDMSDLIAFLNR